MHTHRLRLMTALSGSVLLLSLAACGADSESTPESEAAEPPAATDSVDTPDEAVASDENPIVLGFEISGPAGTVIESTTVAVADGIEQSELDQTWTLTDESKWQLYSTFVDESVMTLQVIEGGPATIKGFRGNAVDANDPTAGYAVSEELSTVELSPGKISILTLP